MLTPPGTLAERHALVCGASSGIGRAVALALAARGAAVTALARTRERLETLMPRLREAGAREARFVVADLDRRPSLDIIIEGMLAQHGPVHILVNNTGGPASGPLLETSGDDLVAAFGRHVLSAHLLTRKLLPGMREIGWGRIVNVISISVREPIANLGVSNTIRGAMASWAKTLAGELPPGITINNVLPGYTATERLSELADALSARTGQSQQVIEAEWVSPVPEGRLARPQEIAAAVAFLASEEASYVRGVSLPVDGGRLKGI